MYLLSGDWPSTSRVSPFGYQGIYACLRLPLAFRSLPRPSSALGALASTLCSSSLDYYPETSLQFSGQLTFSLQLVFLRLVSLPVQLSRCADGFRRLSRVETLKTIQSRGDSFFLGQFLALPSACAFRRRPVFFYEISFAIDLGLKAPLSVRLAP